MTDIPFRVFGPAPLNGGVGEILYTARTGTSKFFIKDITLTNIGVSATRVKMSLGGLTDLSNRVVDQDIAATSTTFLRPLWLMDEAETLEGLQVIDDVMAVANPTSSQTGTDGTSNTIPAWIPAANTLYFLLVTNGVASGTTALNPSSITGNGTWTLINQTTSTVAAARNLGIAAYYWYSSAAGSSATTVINYASTQHAFSALILSATNVHTGLTAVPPWTTTATPIVQSAVAADSVAPASGDSSLTVALTALQTGYVFYYVARATAPGTTVPPTSFTESVDVGVADASGSIGSFQTESSHVTTPPWSSTTVGPATFSTSTTDARASIGFEVVPSNFVNCMMSGIEVR